MSGLVVTGVSPGMGRRLGQQARVAAGTRRLRARDRDLARRRSAVVPRAAVPAAESRRDIVRNCWDQRQPLWPAGWYTFKEALGGFAVGSLAGMAVATLIARFKTLGTALMPIAIAANAIPIIAFAPIFDAWFDPLSPTLEDGDRRRPLLPAGDGEHAARPAEREPAADRADALVRVQRVRRSGGACACRPRCRSSSPRSRSRACSR